ncbi:MAG: NAD(P) transhydrogenase subunit alpha part 2, partial [Rhodospirillales bacterium]|nr:NAD(P) transhydrogenase subunit alpha part 2 [Rhodospirillales bacterium]
MDPSDSAESASKLANEAASMANSAAQLAKEAAETAAQAAIQTQGGVDTFLFLFTVFVLAVFIGFYV